jgi:transcriptional regulator GlxA family with amidase domain
MKTTATNKLPRRFGFLLLNDFTLISLSAAIEPLRMANRICGENDYAWKTLSITGEAVSASDGLCVNVDSGIRDENALDDLDAIIVCGGRRIEKNASKALSVWLRSVDKQGLGLGAICTGSYILADAGLLDGYSCSIHWENMAALADLFPGTTVSPKIFTIDGDRFTSSGGSTPVDMMLHIISSQCGPDVSAGVAEQFIFERIRQSDDEQRVPLRYSEGRQSEKLLIAAELMDANIREPISQEELASYVGLSRRQLQRLFQRYLSCTPSNYYLKVRLQRARQLLRRTSTSIVEISVSTGFVSGSHFSKAYKEMYGHSPSTERPWSGDKKHR